MSAERSPWRLDLACALAILAGLLVIYLPGLGNPLVFDDAYLTDRLAEHRELRLRVRFLSYGSFLWLQDLFGEGWWKQRLVNLFLHFAVVLALAGLWRELLRVLDRAPAAPGEARASYERSPAFWVAIGVFALNPVAVYGVWYLIQRSIVMAALFVVLGLWFFARGLARRQPLWHAAAIACYVAALFSKEHAVLAPLAALPVYIYVARPSWRRLALLATAGLVLVGAAAAFFNYWYGDILARPMDDYSFIYLDQLAQLDPDALRNAYPLSVINQAWLFFQYGVRWFLPVTDWMSIQMRPPFPITWLTFPHLAGACAYVALIAAAGFLVLRYRDWRSLAGVAFLLPALLFPTEFAIVWVQDPFVLYRSYLWAVGVPGVAFLFLHGWPARATVVVAVVLAGVFGWQAQDRVVSMMSAERVYTDAIQKLGTDPRSVGRWFPYINRGNVYFDQERFDLARKDFAASEALGDRGLGAFNVGSILMLQGKPAEALAQFEAADRQGYKLYNLPFQRGMALANLGRPQEAVPFLEKAKTMNPASPAREGVVLYLGRAYLQLGRPDEAIANLEQLLRLEPGNKEGRYILAMAWITKGDAERALVQLDELVKQGPNPSVHYARALAQFRLGRKAPALADIDAAIRLGLDNPNTREWQAKIRAMK